jgi:hypothetical protein
MVNRIKASRMWILHGQISTEHMFAKAHGLLTACDSQVKTHSSHFISNVEREKLSLSSDSSKLYETSSTTVKPFPFSSKNSFLVSFSF